VNGFLMNLAAKALGHFPENIQPRLPGCFEPETTPARPVDPTRSLSEGAGLPSHLERKSAFPETSELSQAKREPSPGTTQPRTVRPASPHQRSDSFAEAGRSEGKPVFVPPLPPAPLGMKPSLEDGPTKAKEERAESQNSPQGPAVPKGRPTARRERLTDHRVDSVREDNTPKPITLPTPPMNKNRESGEMRNQTEEVPLWKPEIDVPSSVGSVREKREKLKPDSQIEKSHLIPVEARVLETGADTKPIGSIVRPEPPVIRVTIGRVDVRAVIPPSPPMPPPPAAACEPQLTLEEYLNQRKAGTR
jgi:hypothetical protein